MRQKRSQVRVILKDGTEWMGRIRMIVSSSSAKARKVVCLEVPQKRDLVRIDDADIQEVVTAELKHSYALASDRVESFVETRQGRYGALLAP